MKVKLLEKKLEARGTKTFYFEKPGGFNFLPGQFMYVTLPKLNYEDARGATRHFTISASPTEKRLSITVRVRQESGFKKTLDELKVGDTVDIEGPNGTLILDESQSDEVHVFLAGGIGITPFRSFIKYNIDKNLKSQMYLIFSNSDSDHTFRKEIEKWTKENNNFKVEFIDSSKSGHLDEMKVSNLLKKWNLDKNKVTFWLVGSPPFVSGVEDVVESLGVSSSNLRTEKFTGY